MSNPPSKQVRPTRRALLGGLGLGAVTLAVEAVDAPPVAATQGQPVIAGEYNTATSLTVLQGVAGEGSGLQVESNSTAILGISQKSMGVQANSHGYWGMAASTDSPDPAHAGMWASNIGLGDGLQGVSASKNGVYGLSHTQGATGVYGDNDSAGYGVVGRSTGTGVGVWANAPDGTALRTTGKIEILNRSGVATIASGKKSIKVNLAGVTATSMVLATVQGTGSFFVRTAAPATDSFTLYINKAPTSPSVVKVAYLVLS